LGVLSFDKDNGVALAALARLSRADGETDQVVEYLERLVDICTGNDRVAAAEELATAYEVIGNRLGATRALERALSADPAALGLREKLRVLYRQEENWTRVAAMMAEDAEQSRDDAAQVTLLRDAATLLTEKQQAPELAVELLERANRKRPEDRTLLLQLCDAYESAGRSDLVVGALERVVESFGGRRSKELADIHRRLATAFHTSGDTERAIAELDKAFRIEPGNIHVLKALGELTLEAGDVKRAQQMFRALMLQKLDAQSPISKAEVFYYLGVVHERLDERAKAIQMLERAVQTDASLTVAQELLTQLQRS
jgi:golgin subfamily B member 1